MGHALTVSSRTPLQDKEVNPRAIRYSMAKRVAIAEDVAAGLSYREVALRHGVSKSTINAAVHSPEIQEIINPRIVEIRKRNLAASFDYHADVALSRLNPEKWDKASALQHIIGAATAVDKAKILRHEANVILGSDNVLNATLSELERIKKERESCSLLLDSNPFTNEGDNTVNNIENPPTQVQIVDSQQVKG